MSLGEAQALNSLGAHLIAHENNLKEAAGAYSQVLEKLSWCVLSPTPFQDGHIEAPDDCKLTIYAFETDEDMGSPLCGSDPAHLQAQLREFFPHPFLFEHDQSGEKDEAPLSSEQHSAATLCGLYNLGLCFHLEYDQHRNKSCALLMARRFYEQAFALAKNCNVSEPQNQSLLPVLMAVCANATHCCCELGNLDQIQPWNRALRGLLSMAASSSFQQAKEDSDDSYLCLSASPHQFFTTHAFLNSFQRSAAHAA